MKKSHIFFALILASICALPSFAQQNQKQASTDTQETIQKEPTQTYSQFNFIFLEHASYGELKEDASHSGLYQLTLYNVNPYMTYFTQRPNRENGIVPVQNFVKAWEVGPNNFKDNNPNGAIISAQINNALNKNSPPLLVTYSNPRYDTQKNILQFSVKPLASQNLLYKEMNFQYVTILIE